MGTIFAMSVTASQGGGDLSASAHLSVREGARRTSVTLRWPEAQPGLNGPEAPTWLYNVLSHLVENFDDHEVVHIEVDTDEDQEAKTDA